MRFPSFHREPPPTLPGITGQVRLDTSTRDLIARVRPGDIALVDEMDLDQMTADSLVRAGAGAVVNVAPSISGRYPSLGAGRLVDAGIPLVDDVGSDVIGRVSDGDLVRLDGRELCIGQRVIAEGTVQDEGSVAAALLAAKAGLQAQLENFAGSSRAFLETEHDLLLDGAGTPDIATPLEGRPVLVVSRGPRDAADLADLKLWLREQRPVLIGVGAGADVLLGGGYTPDLVVGDMDDVSDDVLRSKAELVVHESRDGRTPGLERARRYRAEPIVFASGTTSEDLAVLLALHRGASLVVTAGTADDLVELLDRDRAGMTSTVLTRMQAGGRLVDAQGVAQLYRSGVSGLQILLLMLAGLAALAAALLVTPLGQDWLDRLGGLVISFRYHVVSLAAVLLGLAAGVVLGAGPLDGRLGGTSPGTSVDQQAAADALNAKVADAQARAAYDDAAAAALAPAVLPGQLAGKTVVVVVTPGTDSALVDELVKAIGTSGGKVTGQVEIQPAWFAADQATVLDSLSTQLVAKGGSLPPGGPYVKAGGALAAALVTNAAVPPTKPDEASVTLLTGFEEGGFIKVSGTPARRAQLALVVSPAGPLVKGDSAGEANDSLLPLIAALDSGQGAVLAGPAGSSKGDALLAAMRASAPVRRVVSSSDVADTASGVIATVLALVQQVGGTTGQYGVGPGADAAMPPVTAAGG